MMEFGGNDRSGWVIFVVDWWWSFKFVVVIWVVVVCFLLCGIVYCGDFNFLSFSDGGWGCGWV